MENPENELKVDEKPELKDGELDSQELEETSGGLSLNFTKIEFKNRPPTKGSAIFDDPFFFDVN